MIDINLVPPLQRKKKKAPSGERPNALPREIWIFSLGLFAVVMLILMVVLQVMVFHKLAQQSGYKKAMVGMMTQKVQVDGVIAQIKQAKEKLASLEKVVGAQEIVWSRKLNEMSDNLPRGLWLNRISLQDGVLTISGSALAVNQGDMINVHNFTAALKGRAAFSQDFKSVEIELIKSRDISGTSVADFSIRAELKSRGLKP